MLRLLVIFLAFACACNSNTYKIAVFSPNVANSQILFNYRVAEELARAGHNVTFYLLNHIDVGKLKIPFDPIVHVELVDAYTNFSMDSMREAQVQMAYKELPMWDPAIRKLSRLMSAVSESCELIIRNETFMSHVKEAKYDIVFAHMISYCPIGIVHVAKIPTWIWLNSGALIEHVGRFIGVPAPPSYVAPLMMDGGDRLTFVGRTKSFIGHIVSMIMANSIRFGITANPDTAVFRRVFGDDFPHMSELAAKVPLVMVNSNDLYDFPRPTLAKIVNIGGIGLKKANVKALPEKYAAMLEKKCGLVVMSYGSHAPMFMMPEDWRDAYLHAFAQFPDVQFFIRYEKPEEIKDRLPSNVHASKWLPQTDLLHHPKSLGLITHGGYNSLQDAIHAGIPVLVTALFSDQFRNAHLVERLGTGIYMRKTEVTRENTLANIKRLIEDKELKSAAVKIRYMVDSQPVPAETLLVRWTEFVAQHKNLNNLVPAGADMNILVYHSVDVIVFLAVIVLTILFVTFLLMKCAVILSVYAFLMFATASAFKIAIFGPNVMDSQILFNGRVAEELARAGHDVTYYLLNHFRMGDVKMRFDPRVRGAPLEQVNAYSNFSADDIHEAEVVNAYQNLPVWDSRTRKLSNIFRAMSEVCELLIRNETFMEDVKSNNYDVAFTHHLTYCPIGVIYATKIPSWIWLSTAPLMDNMATAVGVPLPPSYCPPNPGLPLSIVDLRTHRIHSRLISDPDDDSYRLQ